MNEKIKQFAEQAWPGLPSHWWDRRDGEVAEAVNKFAELIVKECLSTVSAKKIFDDATEYEQGYNKALKSVYSDIVSKFEVKE